MRQYGNYVTASEVAIPFLCGEMFDRVGKQGKHDTPDIMYPQKLLSSNVKCRDTLLFAEHPYGNLLRIHVHDIEYTYPIHAMYGMMGNMYCSV